MIPSLREPPFFLGDLGERLPRKDEIPPPTPAAEEVAPGVWRGSDGKLFTQLETPKEPLPDPYKEPANGLMARTQPKRELKIGDKIRYTDLVGTGIPQNFKGKTAAIVKVVGMCAHTSDAWYVSSSPGKEWEFVS